MSQVDAIQPAGPAGFGEPSLLAAPGWNRLRLRADHSCSPLLRPRASRGTCPITPLAREPLAEVSPCCADPFEADREENNDSAAGKDYVHIRIQQRNGKKSLTTIQVGQLRLLA